MNYWNLKKILSLCLALTMLLLAGACGRQDKKAENNAAAPAETATAESSPSAEEMTEAPAEEAEETFAYVHDPSENPNAMKDIVVNPDAVYGFSPDPDSQRLGEFASYDWTDPDVVAQAKEKRTAYEASYSSMQEMMETMSAEGKSTEEIARAVSAERNRLRLAASENDPEELAKVKQSNLDTYGNEDGPTADSLYEKYGSWESVIEHAFSPNLGMDACCGLYDDNYALYQELGLAE